ncbi:MAG TPA: CoA-transferase, partial [Blastococcus sp.]
MHAAADRQGLRRPDHHRPRRHRRHPGGPRTARGCARGQRRRRHRRHGNLVFHESARNFNPLAGMAGRITIAEVEELVEPGEI